MENIEQQKPQTNLSGQKNAVLTALANILIFGAPYLLLHNYGRFFIASFLLIITLFIYPNASILVFIIVIIDTYLLVQKLNKEQIQNNKNTILNILGVLTIIAYIALYTITNSIPGQLAWSKDACNYLYPFNEGTKLKCSLQFQESKKSEAINNEITRMKESKKTDPECEALLKDDYIFGEYCYLKKAFETKDGLYCYGSSEKFDCFVYLATQTGDSKYCDMISEVAKNNCLRYVESKRKVFTYPLNCNGFTQTDRKTRCEQLFGSFFESVNESDQTVTTNKVKRQ